jgi:hypothetical protein
VVNYQPVNVAAVDLSRFLTQNNIPHNLVFIGYPDNVNASHYTELREKINNANNIHILNEDRFTQNAVKYVNQASLVIGTGRGAMEAIVEDVPLAIFSKSNPLPVIVNSNEIFNEAFENNFSKRVKITGLNTTEVENTLISFFRDKDINRAVRRFQESKKEYFDINYVVGTYLKGISEMKYETKARVIDYFRHSKIFISKLIYIFTR